MFVGGLLVGIVQLAENNKKKLMWQKYKTLIPGKQLVVDVTVKQ